MHGQNHIKFICHASSVGCMLAWSSWPG